MQPSLNEWINWGNFENILPDVGYDKSDFDCFSSFWQWLWDTGFASKHQSHSSIHWTTLQPSARGKQEGKKKGKKEERSSHHKSIIQQKFSSLSFPRQ